MDDFLHKLRTGQDRRNSNRRQYNNPLYRGPDRRDGKDHRKLDRRKTAPEMANALDSEVMADLKSLIECISETHKQLMISEERLADAQERTAVALEIIAERLLRSGDHDRMDKAGSISETLSQQPASFDDVVAPNVTSIDIAREKVIEIIKKMRESGSTYDTIAMYLDQENIPTFSGKGNWHAQTVHRIFRQNS